jgi:RNA polymerase sigma factor (TIGR02999 family)
MMISTDSAMFLTKFDAVPALTQRHPSRIYKPWAHCSATEIRHTLSRLPIPIRFVPPTTAQFFGKIQSTPCVAMNFSGSSSSNADSNPAHEVTELLRRHRNGDLAAYERVIALMYPDLRRLAEQRMRAERANHTLQPTALVNEFFIEMATREGQIWNNRSHFLAAASKAMRRCLIDHARARNAQKRGGSSIPVVLDWEAPAVDANFASLLELNDLLDRLAQEEPRMAGVAEMHCFGGLTCDEIGEVLGIDGRTVRRDWKVAKAWLRGQLQRGTSDVRRGMGTS